MTRLICSAILIFAFTTFGAIAQMQDQQTPPATNTTRVQPKPACDFQKCYDQCLNNMGPQIGGAKILNNCQHMCQRRCG